MAEIRVLVWRSTEAAGEPEVEVKIPASLAKWVPRMMALVPRRAKAEVWGEGADYNAIFANFEQLVAEAAQSGLKEILDVKYKDGHLKVLVEG